MTTRFALGPVALLAFCAAAWPSLAQTDYDPAELDLPALIACELQPADYNSLAFWLADEPGAVNALGWQEEDSGNPFLRQFVLAQPVEVFGYPVDRVVFTSSGPMALLDGVAAPGLAATLGVTPMISSAAKFLGEKIVFENSEKDGELTFVTRVALNVSTVESHPGKTLAGCAYSIEVE